MKRKITGLPSSGGPVRIKGAFTIAPHPKHGLVAKAWPKKRGPTKSPLAAAVRTQFGQAAKLSANPIPYDYASAVYYSAGTMYLPRDLLVAAMFGTLITANLSNGQQIVGARIVAKQAQALLDQITTNPGDMLVRTVDGWVGLKSGNALQVLTSQGLNTPPKWADPAGGGPSVGGARLAQPGSPNGSLETSNYASKGVTFKPTVDINIFSVWCYLQAETGDTYKGQVVQLASEANGALITQVFDTPGFTDNGENGWGSWQYDRFATKVGLAAGNIYGIVWTRTDGSGTSRFQPAITSNQQGKVNAPGVSRKSIRFASNNPSVGDAMDDYGSSNDTIGVGFEWEYNS